MPYNTILLTHDGSALADAAIVHAAALTEGTTARVLVLHVVETVGAHIPPSFGWVGASPGMVDIAEEIVAEERAQALSQMERVVTALRAAGATTVQTVIVAGAPGPTIVEVARQGAVDVIVTATHGRSGIARIVLGSVADHVVQHAPCAVLLCRALAAESSDQAESARVD